MTLAIPQDLLDPATIREVRLDFTTNCNLRCVYCPVSRPGYRGEDMSAAILERAIEEIRRLAVHNPIVTLAAHGHGETTIVPDWEKHCGRLASMDLPVGVTTNLSKSYTEEEFDALSRMTKIYVSLDSVDRTLLRRMRRKADIQRIVYNIVQIRSAAQRNRTAPTINFSCGLYDQNSLFIEDVAWLAVSLRVHSVIFWDLVEFSYEGTDIVEADRTRPLAALDDEELRPRLAAIGRAIGTLGGHGIGVGMIPEGFVAALARRVSVHDVNA